MTNVLGGRLRWAAAIVAVAMLFPVGGGCGFGEGIADILDELDDIEFRINDSVDVIQTVDPRFAPLPSGLSSSDTIIIDNSVTVVNNVREDIIIAEIPNSLLLGFENLTGFDIYIQYFADNTLQGVLVFDGETLLLDYPCLFSVELISEDDFDVFTGELVDSFDLSGGLFEEGFDYFCGDALIITFEFDQITTFVDVIDLLP